MTSKKVRSNKTFLRNEFNAFKKWNKTIICKRKLNLVAVKTNSDYKVQTNSFDDGRQMQYSLSLVREVD